MKVVVNNPDFIEMQYITLKKYFIGEYEFIIFNDAKAFPDFTNDNDITIKNRIKEMCIKLGIQCIDIPNDEHRTNTIASKRTADSMNFILDYQIKNPDKYLLLDSDMFLIDSFDYTKYIDYDCAVALQTRKFAKNINYKKTLNINYKKTFTIQYIWNGIYYFDIMKMDNKNLLNWNMSLYCDTGGMMQYWLKEQMKKNTTYFINNLSSLQWNASNLPENLKNKKDLIDFLNTDIRNKDNKYFCEIYDNVFLHYRAGGNWEKRGIDFHKNLTNKLKKLLLND
jgi:hypothetical protein